MHAARRTSRCSWRFGLIVGIVAIALGNSSGDTGASSPISAGPHLADTMRADSDDRIANALFGAESSDAGIRQPVAAPSLTDFSAATQSGRLVTVTGTDFTPGGRVYLAIYDQMGSQLYETRWITASLPVVTVTEPAGHQGASFTESDQGGTLREAFANLCGATAMMRAYDQVTAAWSPWLIVEPDCAADVEPSAGPR